MREGVKIPTWGKSLGPNVSNTQQASNTEILLIQQTESVASVVSAVSAGGISTPPNPGLVATPIAIFFCKH